jgi:hypothetical protein
MDFIIIIIIIIITTTTTTTTTTTIIIALQPFVGPFSPFQFLSQSVGLLGRRISLLQGLYLYAGQHKHRINTHTHPCLEWDSNARPQ